MSEELNQAVPETSAPETVSQVRAADSDDPQALKNKLDLVSADRQRERDEKRAYKKQNEDMMRKLAEYEQQDNQRKQADLLANGKAEELVAQLRGTVGDKDKRIAELEQELQAASNAFLESQLKNSAINAFTQSGVHSPQDLFQLEKDKLTVKDGAVMAIVGGVEVPLQQHLETLKSPGSGRDYFFSGSGARGMSAVGSSTTTSGGQSWSSMTRFEQMTVEAMDEQNGTNNAARLKAAG